jgi:hypothetical protein
MRTFSTAFLIALLCAGLASAGTGGKVVLTTSDYVSGNTAAYDIETGSFADNILGHYQDAYVRTYGRRVFIIESGDNSNIIRLDMDTLKTPVYQYSVGAGSNPHDLVFAPTAAYLKGYVLRYSKPSIWVVNLDAAKAGDFKLGEIDISAWKDADGSPEAHLGCCWNGYVYVVLQRYDLNAFSSGTAVLIKINPATDTLVDMDPITPGVQGVNLIRKNPVAGSLVGGTLYLAGTTYGASDEGVWSVDLRNPANGQKVVVTEKTLGASVAGLYVPFPEYAVVSTYNAAYEMIPRPMNFSTGEFLSPLPAPDAGGGMVLVDGFLYIGSRNRENPGLYIVRPCDEKAAAGFHPTSLPPLTIAYAGEEGATGVCENAPAAFMLEQAHPNPFNPSTSLSFTILRRGRVTLAVYTVAGQKAAVLADSYMAPGRHTVVWDARGMSSGVYIVRLSDGKTSLATKVTLVK